MARKRAKLLADDSINDVDREFARTDFGGTLRAGQLLAKSTREVAQLAYDWLKAAELSNDVGGKRGLGQKCIHDVLEAARCVLELYDPEPQIDAAFEARIDDYLANQAKPRPLSIVAASAVLVSWRTPAICNLFQGRHNICLGFSDLPRARPWLQILPAYLHDDVTEPIQGTVQFEPVADTWSESRSLAEALTNCFPIADQHDSTVVTMAQDFGIAEDDSGHWNLCRTIITINVRIVTLS